MTPTVFTEKIQESKAFYEDCFGAETLLDCGWYLHLAFRGTELSFERPREGRPAYRGGLALNLPCENRADLDKEWERLKALGCLLENPPADHPWGDRSFTCFDPNGIVLYFFTAIPPSPEFQ